MSIKDNTRNGEENTGRWETEKDQLVKAKEYKKKYIFKEC